MSTDLRPADMLALARGDLAAYAAAMWPGFELAKHHELIIEKLEAVERGELKRLMIFMPPRSGKTETCSVYYPAWRLGRDPSRHIIFATHGQELADSIGRRVRNLVDDPMHKAIFRKSRLSADSAAANRFSLTAGGEYFACGRGASVLGRGANLLLIDDVVRDREDAMSPSVRRATQEWYSAVAFTRLQPDAAVVLISTRWHLDDLPGWLLREHAQEGWEVLSLPAIAEQEDGWRRPGDPLWPKFWPLEALERQKAMLGSAAFTALYQQRPIALEGAIFKREWWRFYRAPPTFDRIVLSADTAFQEKETADYSVVTVWGETKTGFYLLHVLRARLEFPALKRRVVSLAETWGPNAVLIENRASGQSLIQELQRETSLPIQPVDVSKDKITRASAVTPTIENGRVFLPEVASWVEAYLDEMSCFPAAPHDDQVDSTTMALNWMTHRAAMWTVEDLARAYGLPLSLVSDDQPAARKNESRVWTQVFPKVF